MNSPRIISLALAVALAVPALHAQPLIENGDFENPEPFKGWIVDYAFSGNAHYVDNKDNVSISQESGHGNVVKLEPKSYAGAKLECLPIPFEPGFRYKFSVDLKGGGKHGYRVYVAGYRFSPGIAPHENPDISELRMVYKGKAESGSSDGWQTFKLDFPGTNLSDQAKQHLKSVRYLTLYIYFKEPGFADNVTAEKVADPSVKF